MSTAPQYTPRSEGQRAWFTLRPRSGEPGIEAGGNLASAARGGRLPASSRLKSGYRPIDVATRRISYSFPRHPTAEPQLDRAWRLSGTRALPEVFPPLAEPFAREGPRLDRGGTLPRFGRPHGGRQPIRRLRVQAADRADRWRRAALPRRWLGV